MIRLIQRRLIIPRGDTGSFSIPILAGKNTGDVAVFTVFDLMTQKKLLEKTVTATNDTLTIEFNHNDTVNLPVGQFVWDIKYYVNPVFADGKLVDGEEIDSYYAAFTLPVCEIRQTGDMMLMVNDAALPPDQLDILLATLNATIAAKNEAVTSAANADTSATNAETSASAALASEQAALESQNAALASQQAAAASAQQALAGAELATIKAEQIAADISNKADRSEIPTKVSDLTDDSGHYTKPATGIPASDLEETYLTEHQDLSNYVQKTDYATTDNAGVVRIDTQYGLSMYGSYITTDPATANNIKKGINTWKPITPENEHSAAFYGLAKAAGSDEKDSELPVGQYTDAAKAAIQQMLDVPSTADIPTVPTNVSAFTNDAGYLTEHQDISGKANVADLAAVATSGSYNDLEDRPTIPDIQINGSSIVNNGVANIPYAETNSYGLVKILPTNTNCMVIQNGMMGVFAATTAQIKNGATDVQPITPRKQHEAVFYGLAKVAGDATQAASENAAGIYTSNASAAIRSMIGAGEPLDVQVNGTSVVSNGIAEIPKMGTNQFGVAQVSGNAYGIGTTQTRYLYILTADDSLIKAGAHAFRPITPSVQDYATFYGLAKAAGDATQSASSNAVGTYTDSAKASIKSMLGIVDGSTGTVDITGTTPTIAAVENTRYVCDEITTLSFTPSASGICIVRFTSGSTPTVVTIPNTVKFPEWFDITALEADTIYEICVTDGIYGAVMSWAL